MFADDAKLNIIYNLKSSNNKVETFYIKKSIFIFFKFFFAPLRISSTDAFTNNNIHIYENKVR